MLTNELYQECKSLYLEGMSISKICLLKKIDRHNLSRRFKNDNITVKSGFDYARKYSLNEHYFDIIDTEEKAYILGFLYADGNNLYTSNRISIQLSKIDEDILKKFSHILYGAEVLKYNSRQNNIGKVFEYITLNLYSKHMSQHLTTLGLVEKKSFKLTFPKWLDGQLYNHFIRGMIDGDGWIYLPRNNRDSPNIGLIATYSMNAFLQDFYLKELKIKSYLVKANKQDINIMCEIRIKNYHQCKIFLDWLYQDATIYLGRKYNLYQHFLEKYKNIREQNQ